MTKITVRLSDGYVQLLDSAAERLHRSRADVIREAVEYYLEDFEALSRTLDTPHDPVLDWERVKRELLDKN